MRHLLFFCLVTISTITKCQIVDNKVKSFIEEQKIDSFFIYTYPCIGYYLSVKDSCSQMDTHYLVWVKNCNSFIKKFQLCKTSKTITLAFDNPFEYYVANRLIINKEKIRQPSYYEYKRTKKGIDTLLMMEAIDHSCYHTFSFSLKRKTIEKTADIFDLEFVKFENGEKNIYYNYNQRTKFKHFIDLTLKLLKELDNQMAF